MLRIAVRRKSCGMRPGQPAARVAVFHALVKRVIGFGNFGPPRPFATLFGKGRKERRVPFSFELQKVLLRSRRCRPKWRELAHEIPECP
jgi:integrase